MYRLYNLLYLLAVNSCLSEQHSTAGKSEQDKERGKGDCGYTVQFPDFHLFSFFLTNGIIIANTPSPSDEAVYPADDPTQQKSLLFVRIMQR
ncbi:MAG: hypothetical protein D3917_03660 [Candidatus Electrothrix sp. AX5]|nr:hypothetical protein [Candidatus Electrothrix sp. AX5]